YQISKKAGIPRSMVYEALGRLDGRGSVLKTIERNTTLYRPVPPTMLLDRTEQEHARLVESLRLSMNAQYNAREEDYVWSITGRESTLAYAAQMIQESQKEVWLVLPDSGLDVLRQELEAACLRGISVNILLTGKGELSCGKVARHPAQESELQGLTSLFLLVMDGKKCLIAGMETSERAATVNSATITTNQHLVLIAGQFVWMEFFGRNKEG
ncbi:MAG: TrmB family transcriptional regulator, partial [Omnitrophica WOR_2 bacterium]